MPFDPSQFGATPVSSFDPTKFGATPIQGDSSATISTDSPIAPPENKGIISGLKDAVAPLDQKLSNMPGVLGFLGSGVYNAAKGTAGLVGSAATDLFQALNHPVDAAKHLYDFASGELQGGADPQTLDTLGNFVQHTLGSKGLLGVAQLPGRVVDVALHPDSPSITPRQALGTAFNGALTALTFGEGNLGAQAAEQMVAKGLVTKSVGQVLKDASTSFAGRSLQSGALSTGFQAAENLQENRPIGENLGQAFGTGLALPGALSTAGKVINKVTPDLSVSSGAEQLKKAVGFRGGKSAEKTQFDNAAPIVFNELKKSGFKLTDSTDPNNLINLSKGIDDIQKQILEERTARIKATGGDPFVSGDLAANKIRSLVEKGSVEDLTNPGITDKLDAIAKNFEGKKYSPVDAQKAIVQANTGFSFADNPALGSKIKMAVSEAFTPELDRIVGKQENIVRDAKGKAIPAKGGTAELNKRWSALQTFSKQLDKKMIIEDRKASYSLPDRLTGAQIAGKVGEAVGNPMKVPEKAVGSAFEYVANKVLGDRNNVNYRIYRAFNGSPMSEAIVGMLNKFQKVTDLLKFLEQNPLIQNILQKITESDSVLHAQENLIPNRQGGFVKNPLTNKEVVKFSDFHPEDQQFLTDIADRIKSKETVSFSEFKRAQDTLKHYDFSAPESKTKLADVILNSSNSAAEKKLDSMMDMNLQRKFTTN